MTTSVPGRIIFQFQKANRQEHAQAVSAMLERRYEMTGFEMSLLIFCLLLYVV